MLIAWAAESAQFFVAQGVALAILAWLQTLPEFAVEAVLAWKQEVPLLLANLTAPRAWRIAAIAALFAAGGGLIYATAEPFLASLLAVSTALGIPNFVFVQWVAPFVSEFPEKVSAFYWARTVERASMALMNMVSSNINQWTLLAAMLPIVYSMSRGGASSIPLDSQQELELLLTLGQSLLSAIFLLEMRLAWWEAAGLFGLWVVQFGFTTAVH